MKEMKERDMDAYNYMSRIPVCHWSRHAFDGHVKSDHMTNNISERFNSWIDKFRTKPALTLLENLQRSFMKCIHKRHEEDKKWKTKIPPRVWTKLTENQDAGRYVQMMCASDEKYEVKEGNMYYIEEPAWQTKEKHKRGADEQAKQKMSSGAKRDACGAFRHNVRSCKHKGDTAGKKKAVGTVLGKKKFHVGSSSNTPQKKKNTTVAASSQPSSQPVLSSELPS
ncbi:hypothetical protein ACOSQ3_019949 [Xanthoceras sorbifolium]